MRDYPHLAGALSETIEKYRKDKGMTKTALAGFAGIERRYLREIEQGSKKPTVNVIYSICEALNVHPCDFFCSVEEARSALASLCGKARDSKKLMNE